MWSSGVQGASPRAPLSVTRVPHAVQRQVQGQLPLSESLQDHLLTHIQGDGEERVTVDDDADVFEVLVHWLYNFALPDFQPDSSRSHPTFAVRIYAIADKYDVEALRNVATQRLSKIIDPDNVESFVDTVQLVNEVSNPRDTSLWDIVTPHMTRNIIPLLRQDAFKEMLRELPELNDDLLAHLDPSYPEGRGRLPIVDPPQWLTRAPMGEGGSETGEDGDSDDGGTEAWDSNLVHWQHGHGRRLG